MDFPIFIFIQTNQLTSIARSVKKLITICDMSKKKHVSVGSSTVYQKVQNAVQVLCIASTQQYLLSPSKSAELKLETQLINKNNE